MLYQHLMQVGGCYYYRYVFIYSQQMFLTKELNKHHGVWRINACYIVEGLF